MRQIILAAILAFAVVAAFAIPSLRAREAAAPIVAAMQNHGLAAANIAYGTAGTEPSFISINAPAGMVRPYYSLSKAITAATAVEVLDLEQTVEGATVRNLLQHTGGWDRAIAGDPVTEGDHDRACVDIPAPAKQFRPGTRFAYSNLGYCLVGRAIAERTGKSYDRSVRALFPETRAMAYDPWLGPAGGWSGTVAAYYEFASRKVRPETIREPVPRTNDLPYGLGWGVGPDLLTHFGVFDGGFSIVLKKGGFVAVGVFDGRPPDDAAAAKDLRTALLTLRSER